MAPADETKAKAVQEGTDHIRAEGVAHAPSVGTPADHPLIRVGPEDVADQSGLRNLKGSLNIEDLVEVKESGTQAAVATEDTALDDRRQGQAVVAIDEGAPQLGRESPLALVVEPIEVVQAGALVVAAQQEKILRIPRLQGQQQGQRFDGLLAPVHIVAEEQIVRLWRISIRFEVAQHILELSVNVAE